MGVQLSHSGSTAIPSGVSVLTITGLGLTFTPTSVSASVRKPLASDLNISATPYGVPTAAGFSVELSAETDSTGYILDWIVWAQTAAVDTTGTLLIAYADLCVEVSRFLGYPALASQTADQTAEVDRYVQSGVRQFYYPAGVPGVEPGYEWSFLKPSASISTADGDGAMDLPTSFGRMIGDLHYEASANQRPIVIVSEARILALLQKSADEGAPQYAAIRFKQEYGAHGQVQEIVFWPIPDAVYALTYRYEAYNGKLSAVNPCPLGGMRHSELITESCLAVAEQRANDERGLHTERFNLLLAAGVAQDRRGGARYFGPMGGSESYDAPTRVLSSVITYNGVTV